MGNEDTLYYFHSFKSVEVCFLIQDTVYLYMFCEHLREHVFSAVVQSYKCLLDVVCGVQFFYILADFLPSTFINCREWGVEVLTITAHLSICLSVLLFLLQVF